MESNRNARQEAFDRLAGRYEVRVLEPSPPAVTDPPWFADDPVARGEVPSSREVVSPVGTGDLRWEDLARENADLAGWCADRWLANYRRLGPLPDALIETREALHRLAEHVLAPTRQRANGKIGLRWTLGGFGTPFFGADVQLRVVGDVLIMQRGTEQWRGRLTSIRDAAEFVGHELTRMDTALHDAGDLEVNSDASRFLGDWFGFSFSVLEELRNGEGAEHEPSRVQIWPEHFDAAVELGSEADGTRAAYGCSPGDEDHAEPYCYVAPWSAPPEGELWKATDFAGAELPYAQLAAADNQRDAALSFFITRLRALAS